MTLLAIKNKFNPYDLYTGQGQAYKHGLKLVDNDDADTFYQLDGVDKKYRDAWSNGRKFALKMNKKRRS